MDSPWFPAVLVLAVGILYYVLVAQWERRQARIERGRRRALTPDPAAGDAAASPAAAIGTRAIAPDHPAPSGDASLAARPSTRVAPVPPARDRVRATDQPVDHRVEA